MSVLRNFPDVILGAALGVAVSMGVLWFTGQLGWSLTTTLTNSLGLWILACVVAGLGSQLSSWVLWRVGLTNSWRDLKQKLPSGSLRDFSGVAECFSIPSDTRYRFTLRDGRIVDAPEPFSSTTGKKAEALKKVWRKCGGGELSFMPEKPHP